MEFASICVAIGLIVLTFGLLLLIPDDDLNNNPDDNDDNLKQQ